MASVTRQISLQKSGCSCSITIYPQRKRKRIDVINSADNARARAEAVFRTIAPAASATSLPEQSAMQEYRAKQQAELDKAARLRAMRLAKGSESSRPAGKGES
jgi:hypothetical protein